MNKALVWLIQKKKRQNTTIWKKRCNITTDIKRVTGEYYKQCSANIFDNSDEGEIKYTDFQN